MKINTNTLLINLLLAGLSEKMLNNKYAGLPKSWKIKQALSMSLLPDPAIGMMLHQNELIKEDEKIMQINQEKTDEGIQIIHDFIIDEEVPPEIRESYAEEIQDMLKPDIFSPDEDIPFSMVEEVPIFPGCDENASDDEKRTCFRQKLQEHIENYSGAYLGVSPEEGETVAVTFIIDKDGSITGISTQGPNEYFKTRAEIIIGELPGMTPGKHQEKTVRVMCSIFIEFRIEH